MPQGQLAFRLTQALKGRTDPKRPQPGLRRRKCLLAIDIPVAQILQRNGLSGDGTTHESARTPHAVFSIEKINLGFDGRGRTTLKPVHVGKFQGWGHTGID